MLVFILILALLSVAPWLWWWWVGTVLRSQKGVNSAVTKPTLEPVKINLDELTDFQRRSQYRLGLPPMSLTTELEKQVSATILEAEAQKTHQIDRKLRIYHSRSIYLHRAFYLDICIWPHDEDPPELKEKAKKFEVTTESMQFEAREEEPLVQVELKFAEGEFNANKTQAQQKLKKDEKTKFRFLLKPLKAEHCILTVVISYVSDVPVLSQIVETVTIDKTIEPGEGLKSKEYVKQAKTIPASIEKKIAEVKTIELLVSVKSLFGRNARELELLQKAFAPVVAVILIGLSIFTGKMEITDATWYTMVSIINAAGIPLIDKFGNPLEKPDPDKPDEYSSNEQ